MGNSRDENIFRSTLKKAANDGQTRAILIGENHNASYTPDALLSNLDILEQLQESGRKIVFVFEDLPQRVNESSTNFTETASSKNFELYNLFSTLQSKGITVLGAENKVSNPFIDVNLEQASTSQIKEMTMYGGSVDRTKNANNVFSDVIKAQDEDALVIFVGGAAHIPEARLAERVEDVGMGERIGNSKTIYLTSSSAQTNNETIQINFSYKNSDTNATGRYDYCIGSSSDKVIRNRFDSAESFEDKKRILFEMLNNLIQSYIKYPQKSGSRTFNEKYERILDGFKNSTKMTNSFTALSELKQEILKKPDLKTAEVALKNAISVDAKRQVNFSSTALISRQIAHSSTPAIMMGSGQSKVLKEPLRSSRITKVKQGEDMQPLQPVAADTGGLTNRNLALDANRPAPAGQANAVANSSGVTTAPDTPSPMRPKR